MFGKKQAQAVRHPVIEFEVALDKLLADVERIGAGRIVDILESRVDVWRRRIAMSLKAAC